MRQTSMVKVNYDMLKTHFDNLVSGGFNNSTGLELIREEYEDAFNLNINRYDIQQTNLNNGRNPIKSIITLVNVGSYDERDVPTGIFGFNEVVYTNKIDVSDIKYLDDDTIGPYARWILESIDSIISKDTLYSDKYCGPQSELLYLYPLYLTFHTVSSIKGISFSALKDIFLELMEYYYEIDEKIFESMATNAYTIDTMKIYNTMTCDNTIHIMRR